MKTYLKLSIIGLFFLFSGHETMAQVPACNCDAVNDNLIRVNLRAIQGLPGAPCTYEIKLENRANCPVDLPTNIQFILTNPMPLGGLINGNADFSMTTSGNTYIFTPTTPGLSLDLLTAINIGSLTLPNPSSIDFTTTLNFNLAGTPCTSTGLLTTVMCPVSVPQACQDPCFWTIWGNDNVNAGNFIGTINEFPLHFRTFGQERMTISEAGHVGIGVEFPTRSLEVNQDIIATGNFPEIAVVSGAANDVSFQLTNSQTNWQLGVDASDNNSFKVDNWYSTGVNSYLTITSAGNVGIGTEDPQSRLAVAGSICTEEVRVAITNGCWSDYVFAEDYELRTLAEVEQFILKNKHLPDVPSALEVESNGIELGKMDALLLKKIEELTLYVIDLQKENEEIKSELKTLKK